LTTVTSARSIDASPRVPVSAWVLRAGSQSSSSRSPVQLEACRAHDDRRVGAIGLQRRERSIVLAETLLVGEKRAPLRRR